MLGLGTSLISGAPISTLEELLRSAFDKRVTEDGGALENDACLLSALGELVTEPAPFTTGLLEFYPNAVAAYSLRQLRRSIFPYAIRVRRSGDSLEQDIGFNSNGELDTNALLAFAGSGDAWVATLYDQSSNGNNAVQSTPDSQPQIVASGSIVTENGKPAMQFDGINDRFPFDNSALDISSLSSFTVGTFNDIATDQVMLGLSGGVSNKRWYSPYVSGGNFNYGYAASCCAVRTTADTNQNLHTLIAGSILGGFEAFLNSSSVGTDTLSSGIDVTNEGIMNLKNAYNTDGTLQEVIVYSSDQSANRTGIESNINTFYSIYS